MPRFSRVFPSILAIICAINLSVYSQEVEPAVVYGKVLQGETYEYTFEVSGQAYIVEDRTKNIGGTLELDEVSLNFVFKLVYDTEDDFVGESRILLRRAAILGGNDIFTEVVVQVVPSMLEAKRDIIVLPPDQDEVSIDVLWNDVAGSGNSTLVGIDLVSDGSASIIGDKIQFTKAIGFEGETSFNYTIQDESGYMSSSIVTVIVGDPVEQANTSLNYLTSAVSPVDIFLIDPTYELAEGSDVFLGDLDASEAHVIRYVPNQASKGQETFTLVNDHGDEIQVTIDIVDDGLSSLAVRDDKYFTTVSTPITFDPRDNDYDQNGVLIDYSDELTINGDGALTFTPPTGYSGVREFSYTILQGAKEISGVIEIYVSNYMPQRDEYDFQTTEGEAFLIEYLAPISNYSWNMVSPPSNGMLEFNRGSHVYACGVASGKRMTIYTPITGFVGNDRFVLEYCIDDGPCKEVAVNMSVLPSDGDCGCRGSDCVWPGDANNDGKVSVSDILSIGYNYGEIGTARTSSDDAWSSNHAEDWPFDQEGSEELNNKYADSNGDGIVDSEDADALYIHLDSYNNITADEVNPLKDIPLIFVETSTGPYEAGDVATLDVYLGTEEQPAIDVRGIVFATQFPSDVIDPNSIKFTLDESWIGAGSTILSATSSSNGLLEVGISRTSGQGVFGADKIGTTSLTVQELIDPWIPGEEDAIITFTGASIKNTEGKSFDINGEKLVLDLVGSGDLLEESTPSIIIYPNPTEGQLTFHANRRDVLHNIELFDMTGKMVSQHLDINNQSFQLNQPLGQGIYTARITSEKGVTVEKVQVVDGR